MTDRDVLFLRVRTLEKYKQNYELLCSQLSELNTQVGLQLQRHEMDEKNIGIIKGLENEKAEMSSKISELEMKVATLTAGINQEKEYTERIHDQLATAAELLKTSERNQQERDMEYAEQMNCLHRQMEEERRNNEVMKFELTKLKSSPTVMDNTGDTLKVADIDYKKDNKKLRKKIEEYQCSIERQQKQLVDECRRRDIDFDTNVQAAQRRIAQLQQDAICLSDIATSSKSHAKALELQLEAAETLLRKTHLKETELLHEIEIQSSHHAQDVSRLTNELNTKENQVKALEKKVRSLKIRWKDDREHLKSKIQTHNTKDQDVDVLRQQARELETCLLVANKKNRILENEITSLRDILDEATLKEETRYQSRTSVNRYHHCE
ncbi:hypothetical protein THRCLA_06468, partial [Thraustotheca clavata]